MTVIEAPLPGICITTASLKLAVEIVSKPVPLLVPNVIDENPSFIAAMSLSRMSIDPVPESEDSPTVIF